MCHRINLPEEFQVLQLGMSRKVKIIFSVPCNSLRMRMTALGPGLALLNQRTCSEAPPCSPGAVGGGSTEAGTKSTRSRGCG